MSRPGSTTRAARRARKATSDPPRGRPTASASRFTARQTAPPTNWLKTFSRNPNYELTLTGILPSYNAAGDKFVMTGRPAPGTGARRVAQVVTTGTNTADVIYQDKKRNVMAPQLVAGRRQDPVRHRRLQPLLQRLQRPGPQDRRSDRRRRADRDGQRRRQRLPRGDERREQQRLPVDGARRQAVRLPDRSDPTARGLRIMNLETKAVTKLTEGYDNFPLWSPRGDLIMFSRAGRGRLRDLHDQAGRHRREASDLLAEATTRTWPGRPTATIVWASSRMGFKDEGIYTDAPQPYGELFVMRYDGTDVQQLTDNQWEDGTPAWQPARRPPNPDRPAYFDEPLLSGVALIGIMMCAPGVPGSIIHGMP